MSERIRTFNDAGRTVGGKPTSTHTRPHRLSVESWQLPASRGGMDDLDAQAARMDAQILAMAEADMKLAEVVAKGGTR